MLLQAVESVLGIALMLGVGFFLSRKGYMGEAATKLVSFLVTGVALPCYMVYNLTSGYDRAALLALLPDIPAPFVSVILCFLLGLLFAKILKVPKSRFYAFATMFAMPNTIFMGLPVNRALFGEQSVPFVLVYYMATTLTFWTVCVNGIKKDGDPAQGRIFTASGLKKLLSPALIGFFAGVIIVLSGFDLKQNIGFLSDTLNYIGSMVTPLSMIFIGSVLQKTDFRKLRFSRDMAAILIGKFVAAPLLAFAAALIFNVPRLAMDVFIVQAAMPILSQTAIVSKQYNADAEYAAVMVSLTTILSLAVIPVVKIILT